jgi:HSP20 family molecular chaperone IbpA
MQARRCRRESQQALRRSIAYFRARPGSAARADFAARSMPAVSSPTAMLTRVIGTTVAIRMRAVPLRGGARSERESCSEGEAFMTITRWEPSADLFRPFFEDLMSPSNRLGMRSIDTDVIETEGEIRVVCEMPGMRPDDIDVELENNVLTLRGEKHEERSDENGDDASYHLRERRWGRFTRSFVLPREVEQDRIRADYADGILTVTIPKSEKARRRRIEIGHGDGQTRQVGTRTT